MVLPHLPRCPARLAGGGRRRGLLGLAAASLALRRVQFAVRASHAL
jgi:hypothetical protein